MLERACSTGDCENTCRVGSGLNVRDSRSDVNNINNAETELTDTLRTRPWGHVAEMVRLFSDREKDETVCVA